LARRVVLLLRLLLRERLRVARQVRLRLARPERRIAAGGLGLLAAVPRGGIIVARPRPPPAPAASPMRSVFAGMLPGGGDQAVIVLGVLVVVLGGDGIAGGLRVAGELDIFFGNVGGVSPDFDVGAVRFVDARHRIMILAVAAVSVTVTVVVIPAAH